MLNVKEVGKKLREIRGDMNQQECAAKLGISRAALSYYENGSRAIDVAVLHEFCKLFNVTSDYVLGLSSDPTTDKDTKTAIAVTGLSEKAIQAIQSIDVVSEKKEDLNYILESEYFKEIAAVFANARFQRRFLYSKDRTNWEETTNYYLDDFGIDKTRRVSRIQIDLLMNGIESVFKQQLTEKTIKLFDEFKEYILSRPYYSFPVCIYPHNEGYIVTVPDIPGCTVEGESRGDAINKAIDTATKWVCDCLDNGKAVPEPTDIDKVNPDEYEDGEKQNISLDVVREF